VTGGTGFIGSEVVRTLVQQGEPKPGVFDINPSMQLLDDLSNQIDFMRGDLGNFSHVLNAVKRTKPQTIYHLGGMLSLPSEADPWAAMRANALGTFHVLEAARLFDVAQVIFASTIGTYGLDITGDSIDDYTLQRPRLFYGATKVFGELMGRFYQRKYRLDFRGVRYPAIVGPGIKTPGAVQYAGWMIEESAKRKPFTVWVRPDTITRVMYFKDAASAVVRLAAAPVANIRMAVYLVGGTTTTAQEIADVVRDRLPTAQIDFRPDPELQPLFDTNTRPIDDRVARQEWGWQPSYDLTGMVDDFLRELELHSRRYL
jgi:nucleoside-diphosphate-sugar epimerase